jgi:hypothetical protein
MVEELERVKLPSRLKQAAADTLREKLSEVELIECISCINALKNNEFDPATASTPLPTQNPPSSEKNPSPRTSAWSSARTSSRRSCATCT